MDHIAICIATFKRPQLLEALLNAIERQMTGSRFRFSVIIVDNDANASAQTIAENYTRHYHIESEKNIALARNRAVTEAMALGADFIAFIDDDEVPVLDWLLRLYEAIQGMDIVHGPVRSDVPNTPFYKVFFSRLERARSPSLTNIGHGTGNCLIRAGVFQQLRFDPAFGISGGEDSDFFYRAWQAGLRFGWAQDAVVTETVPPNRITVQWALARAFRGGNSFIRIHQKNTDRRTQLILFGTLWMKLFIDVIYIPIMPLIVVASPVWFWRIVRKSFGHLGQLYAFMNYVYLEYR